MEVLAFDDGFGRFLHLKQGLLEALGKKFRVSDDIFGHQNLHVSSSSIAHHMHSQCLHFRTNNNTDTYIYRLGDSLVAKPQFSWTNILNIYIYISNKINNLFIYNT